MTDIVYWGNGDQILGEYPTPKDVDTATKIESPGGISVDWGDGDTEILPGNDWTITNFSESDCSISSAGRPELWQWVTCCSETIITRPTSVPTSRCISTWILRIGTQFRIRPSSRGSGTRICGRRTYEEINIIGEFSYPEINGTRSGSGGYGGAASSFAVSGNWTTEETNYYRVETNAGAISERPAEIEPSITLGGDCAIAIAYEDGTNEEIPLSSCPEWVRVRSDDECPDGTCRVECVDHYCCYGCDGKPVKEIPK